MYRYREPENKTIVQNSTLPLTSIGLIVFIVFLVLKLCNMNNPDFEWLTWFWVWFPLWLPWAIEGALFLVIFIIALIIS